MSDSKKPPAGQGPSPGDAAPPVPQAPWEVELLTEVLQPLREDTARRAVAQKYGVDHASIEAFLRSPETRRQVAKALTARLVELIPVTLKNLCPEILAKKGWAIKLLLDALRFDKVADQVLVNADSQEETIISSAFEKELVQSMLDTLRGKPPENGEEQIRDEE